MAWLFTVNIEGWKWPQYIWCDWPRAQRCYLKYAPAIGIPYFKNVGRFLTYQGETWFDQWESADPDDPWYWEAPGSEGRGEYTRTGPVYYVLKLEGVKHNSPKTPAFGQSGTGKIIESPEVNPSTKVTWKLTAGYS